jgi:hypothetical protein
VTLSYLDIIRSQWEKILNLYLQFESEKPVMVLDLSKNEIFAYPFQDFSAQLDRKSQATLRQQYQNALTRNQMVIFVKDDDQESMASFTVKIYEDHPPHD